MNRTRRTKTPASRRAAKPSVMARAQDALQRGELRAAIRLFEKAVKTEPGRFEAWANLGGLYLDTGKADQATAAFARALAIDPTSVPVLANAANLANQQGDSARALDLYRRVLDLAPDDAEVWHDLARIKKFSCEDPDIATMQALAMAGHLGDEARMYLDFALGKALEDAGDFDGAFDHLSRANKLKRAALPFNLASETRLADRLMQTFDQAFFTHRLGMGIESQVPVFILGMPRSGTTLVEQILSNHSQVFGAGEVNDLANLAGARVVPFPDASADMTSADAAALGNDYVSGLRALAPDALRITDKMPRNFYFIGLIAMAMPNARIIHCRRSAMDTCFSCYSMHFPLGQAFSYDLASLGGYYRNYRRLMEHWHRVLPGRVLDVDYETVVSDIDTMARRLVAHCGLEWEDACLDFHNSTRQVATASATQVRQPVHDRSVARWRRFESHLGELLEALGGYADEASGPH